MKKINSVILILKNSKFLKFYLNLFKKYDIKKIYIVNLDNKKKTEKKLSKHIVSLPENKNINKYIVKSAKKIKENFFLINSEIYPLENLFRLEKFFFNKRKSILFNNNDSKEKFKINLALIKYSDLNEIFVKGNLNKFIVKKKIKLFNLEKKSLKQKKNFFKDLTKKVIFLDRDGVINEDNGYVGFRNNFVWMPGSIKTFRYLVGKNYNIFVITNQSGIARGFFSESDVLRLHQYILDKLRKNNCYINQIYYSPFHKEGIIKKYKKNSNCRKPGIKIYKDIKRDWGIRGKNFYMIGDQITDMMFAKKAGIKGKLFKGNNLYNFIKKIV